MLKLIVVILVLVELVYSGSDSDGFDSFLSSSKSNDATLFESTSRTSANSAVYSSARPSRQLLRRKVQRARSVAPPLASSKASPSSPRPKPSSVVKPSHYKTNPSKPKPSGSKGSPVKHYVGKSSPSPPIQLKDVVSTVRAVVPPKQPNSRA